MLDSLRLQNFRSYKDASFEFESGVNIIVGPNASGKTNLLEAILVVSRASSYRGKDKDLIANETSWARLDATLGNRTRTIKIELAEEGSTTTKTTLTDNKEYNRLPHTKRLPVVIFEPNHLRILSGSPENRRQFFDSIIAELVPGYSEKLRRYQRTLAQRNALLKQRGGPKQLFVWNIRLTELAQNIVDARQKLIDDINARLQTLYRKIAGNKLSQVELKYQASCSVRNYSASMLGQLENSYDREVIRGFTMCGPHRDDFQILLNGQNSSQTASRGETRTLLLAIKIIELELLEQATNQKPLLLLDDVFSELDGARRQALTKQISKHQTFITTTDADVVVQHFMDNCHIIPLGPTTNSR